MACAHEWRIKTSARFVLLLVCLVHVVCSFNPGRRFIPFGLTPPGDEMKKDRLRDEVTQMERKQDAVEKGMKDFTNIVNKTVTGLRAAEKEASVKGSELKSEINKLSAGLSGFESLVGNASEGLMSLKTRLKAEVPRAKPEEDDSTGCPVSKGYHLLNSKICLRLSDWNDTRKWEDSRRACQEEKGDLITFKDAAEEKDVLDYLNHLGDEAYSPVYPVMRLWVGMDKHTGLFTWVSDSKFKGTWNRFSPHDNWLLQCVSIAYDGLVDAMCGSKRRYVCQINLKN